MMPRSIESERAAARERHFDALVEEVQEPAVPVAGILARAASADEGTPTALPTRRASPWLTAALILLGIGVFVTVILLRDPGAPAEPVGQDPERIFERLAIPTAVMQVHRPGGVDRSVAAKAESVELSFPLYSLRSLRAFPNLEHLRVELPPAAVAQVIENGHWGDDGTRLQALVGANGLRSLTLDAMCLAVEDLEVLAEVPALESLRLLGVVRPGDKQARCRRFDESMAQALAQHCSARSLTLDHAAVEPGALRALAPMGLRELVLSGASGPESFTPEVLLELGELESLERLELGMVHSARIDGAVQIWTGQTGVLALTPSVLQALAKLPRLRDLAFEQCALDDELVRALPRQLTRLDLATCSGFRGAVLGEVLTSMGSLVELGLSLSAEEPEDWTGLSRSRLAPSGPQLHSLTVEEARACIDRKPWRGLRLSGPVAQGLAEAIERQSALVQLELSSANGGVSLGFIERIPGLRRIVLRDLRDRSTDLLEEVLRRVAACPSLERVDCLEVESALSPERFRELLGPSIDVGFWRR